MVGEFIDKVVVHHRQKEQGVMQQRVEIFYKMIGHVSVPMLDKKTNVVTVNPSAIHYGAKICNFEPF